MPNCCRQEFSAQRNISPQNKNSRFAITYCCNFILHLIFSFNIKECVLAAQGREKCEHRKQRQLPAFNVEILVYKFFWFPGTCISFSTSKQRIMDFFSHLNFFEFDFSVSDYEAKIPLPFLPFPASQVSNYCAWAEVPGAWDSPRQSAGKQRLLGNVVVMGIIVRHLRFRFSNKHFSDARLGGSLKIECYIYSKCFCLPSF